jgi:AcrR family transcriptional regulator
MSETPRPTARERLLQAADELFYAEGIHTVGIDRVIEHAGVAKASLYSCFGSKDELVRAYLMRRHERRVQRMTAVMAEHPDPTGKLLAIFDYLADAYRDPGFRGCAFMNANAESAPGGPAEQVADLDRGWVRSLIHGLLIEASATDPDLLTRQLVLLFDGATVSARLDRRVEAAVTAKATAQTLLASAGLPATR